MFQKLTPDILIEIINCIVQTVVAISGWLLYMITRRQVPSTTKAKFKICSMFVPVREKEETVVNLNVDIVNLGMAPIFVEEWGVALHRKFSYRCEDEMVILSKSFEDIKLEPGRPCKKSFPYPEEEIEDYICRYGKKKIKASIYIKYHLGEVYNSKWESYTDFEEKFARAEKRVTLANKEIEKLSRGTK